MSIKTEVSTIVMHEGKVLVGRFNPEDTKGQWETPAGVIGNFEGVKEAAERVTFSYAGITVKPENIIFVSEFIKQEEDQHRIIIFLYANYVNGELTTDGLWSEAQWVDVRELGSYQNEMSDVTVDAFYKFSMILRQMAQR